MCIKLYFKFLFISLNRYCTYVHMYVHTIDSYIHQNEIVIFVKYSDCNPGTGMVPEVYEKDMKKIWIITGTVRYYKRKFTWNTLLFSKNNPILETDFYSIVRMNFQKSWSILIQNTSTESKTSISKILLIFILIQKRLKNRSVFSLLYWDMGIV